MLACTLVFLKDAWTQLGKGKLSQFSLFNLMSWGSRHRLIISGRLKQALCSDFQTQFKSRVRDLELSGQGLKQIMDIMVIQCQYEGMYTRPALGVLSIPPLLHG